MITQICNLNTSIVMGTSALGGALIYSGYTIYRKKKELGKKFKFDAKKLIDTAWQSCSMGIAAGLAIGCSWYGILVAVVSGIGIDSVTNKLKINKTQLFNVVELVAKLLTKADSKIKKKK